MDGRKRPRRSPKDYFEMASSPAGARVITYVRLLKGKVYLLTIYDKADQASLTQKELHALLEGLGT
jgi:hypothetical protein